MVDTTPFLPGLSPVQGKAVVARFDGGRLSSEGGLLVLREVERRLGLADRLATCLKDRSPPPEQRLASLIDEVRYNEDIARVFASADAAKGTAPSRKSDNRC